MGWFENIKYNLQGLDKLEIAKLQKEVTDINKLLETFEGSPGQVTELSNKLDSLSRNFTELSDKFDGLSGKFEGLSAELSGKFDNLSERFTELSGKFDGLSTDLSDKFNGLQEKFTGLQEKFTGLEEKVETLTETVADQEKTLLICAIVSAVAAIAITSFVAFCIYQGVKCEREKEKNLSKDTPDTKLNDKVDTQVQQNSLYTPN